jgi:hypothetical protein
MVVRVDAIEPPSRRVQAEELARAGRRQVVVLGGLDDRTEHGVQLSNPPVRVKWPAAPDESRPHISWELRTGGPAGELRLVCESSKPAAGCVMDATTTQRQTVTVHLYLHPTKSQTSYLGFMRMPFLDDADQLKPSDVNTTVPPGRLPGRHDSRWHRNTPARNLLIDHCTGRHAGRPGDAEPDRAGGSSRCPLNPSHHQRPPGSLVMSASRRSSW